jgi:glucose/arabinose dehydrogenase
MNTAILKLVIPIVAVVVLSVVTFMRSPSDTTIPIPQPIFNSSMNNTNSDKGIAVVAEKLQTPWSIVLSNDGRVFFTERIGTIRMLNANGTLAHDPVGYIRVDQVGEGGLLGIDLHPNFTSNHKIYIYHTYSNSSGIYNRVMLLVENENKIVDSQIILDGIPGGRFHDGGRLKFGPDNKLYISTGDAGFAELSQNKSSLAGKILRINDDGTIPIDNPFPGSAIYAYGFRNVQGLTWHPETRELYASDHGATGNDEINVVRAGSNYGWPYEECSNEGKYTAPVICFNPSIAPSGIAIPNSSKLGYSGDLLLATLKGSQLRSIDLYTGEQNNILVGYGRLRDVVEGYNGSLFVLTSNTDGRGLIQENDDKILRIFKD